STDAEPVNDCAPNCWISPPTCSAITAPNGMATSAVGTIVTEAMNQDCWRNSRSWKGRRNRLRRTSSANANNDPAVPMGASTRLAVTVDMGRAGPDQAPGARDMLAWNDPGGGVTPFSRHQAPGSRCDRRRMPLEGSSC